MKERRNSHKWLPSALVGLGLAVSSTICQAAPDRVLGTFDFDVAGWSKFWGGSAAPVQDAAQDNTGNGGGACYITGDCTVDQSILTVGYCLSGNPWWNDGATNFNMSEYRSVEFDIKWDTANSTLSVADFNAPPLGGEGGIIIWAVDYADPPDPKWPTLGVIQVPAEAATGWAHVSLPINPALSGIDPSKGIAFKKWVQEAQKNAGGTFAFWVDNVVLKGTDAPPPPPSLSLSKPLPGLAFVASGGGQYDRQNIRTVNSNYTWMGASGPVSYSIDVTQHADNAHPGFQIHFYFVPGVPDAARADADWHYPNVLFYQIGNNADGSAWSSLHFKTNAPESNGHLYDTGNIGGPGSTTTVGTWTITFEPNSNITMTSPSGTTMTTNLPSDVVPIFNDQMQVHVGIVPGSLDRLGQMATLTGVRFQGMKDAPAINSSFLGQPLDTNVWEILASPNGVQEIPADSMFWVDWTLPASGFGLQGTPTLTSPSWKTPAPVGADIGGKHRVLLRAGDMPGANTGFWRLTKRNYSKLQVLLPGETAAPDTETGKTGTPTPQAVNVPFDIVVNAVDETWNLVRSANGTIHVTSSDQWFLSPDDAALQNGTRTFNVTLSSTGSWTLTATDTTDNTKTPGTSSAVSVQ